MDVDEVFETIRDGVVVLVATAAKTFTTEAKSDFDAFFTEASTDLKRYTHSFAGGHLTRVEYELLVGAKATNAKMLALSAKGIARARIKHLQNSIRDLILNTVFAALPG